MLVSNIQNNSSYHIPKTKVAKVCDYFIAPFKYFNPFTDKYTIVDDESKIIKIRNSGKIQWLNTNYGEVDCPYPGSMSDGIPVFVALSLFAISSVIAAIPLLVKYIDTKRNKDKYQLQNDLIKLWKNKKSFKKITPKQIVLTQLSEENKITISEQEAYKTQIDKIKENPNYDKKILESHEKTFESLVKKQKSLEETIRKVQIQQEKYQELKTSFQTLKSNLTKK